jgi:hypothetical protein
MQSSNHFELHKLIEYTSDKNKLKNPVKTTSFKILNDNIPSTNKYYSGMSLLQLRRV